MNILQANPLVSVLMNCYNASSFIERAVQSVIEQDYKNWELIIWDDGSTDKTPQILKKIKDERVKIFFANKNCGLGISRIKAAEQIKGDLVTVLDSDDYIHHTKLQKQVEIFLKNPQISLCTTWVKIYDENFKLKKKFQSDLNNDELRRKLIFINTIPNSSVMYKKEDAKKIGWYSNLYEYSQDYDLSLKLTKNKELFLIKDFLTNMTDHKTNMSSLDKYSNLRIKENIEILKNNYNSK